MKKLYALLICLALSLCGCAGDIPVDEAEENLIVVGVSQIGAESEWRVANSESIKSSLTEENGYRLLFDVARQKQENQIIAVRKFIQQQVDYIVIVPLCETGWDSVLQEARDAGIPVILADRMVAVDDESLYSAHVGSDFFREGEHAVQWLEENADPEMSINILHIQGTRGSSAQIGRTAALEEAVKKYGNWTLLAQLDGDFTFAKAYSVVRDYLSQQSPAPEIDVLYCENDNEAFGSIQALEEAGYKVGGDGGVKVITFDATRTSLEACLNGKISLAVECNPLLGPLIQKIIRKMERGGTPEKNHYVEEKCFTQDMLTEELIAERQY